MKMLSLSTRTINLRFQEVMNDPNQKKIGLHAERSPDREIFQID